MTHDPYRDEQLVELYDTDNPARDDHNYYLALADRIDAKKILDFGCGTGLLTRALASPGRIVIGVDPSATMLAYARRQPGAETVTWVAGDASAIDGVGDVDLVVSAGNAMMHISPKAYPMVLNTLAATLKRDGVLSFDSRNPAARAWDQWTRQATYVERDISSGPLREWLEVTEAEQGRVVFNAHNVFQDGPDVVYTSVLYFRTADEITCDLGHAGFRDMHVHGGWHGEEEAADSRVLVFLAHKR